ncbi:MAG: N-acetylmuramoyl-L-alanine amidase [Burkholderiales bacterium]|nr:N-acetylmuramoyl-L-alanine amidase [Burkholderiales bacterium]
MRDRNRPPFAACRTLIDISLPRRRLWQWLLLPGSSLLAPATWADAVRVASARLWPSPDYSRLIIETSAPLVHQWQTLRHPDRLVLDLEGIDASSELAALPRRVQPADPYVAAIRLGRHGASAMRVVLDLRSEVRPDVFAVAPVGEYGYRLVVDVYPLVPLDPLMALLESERQKEVRAALQPPAAGTPAAPGNATTGAAQDPRSAPAANMDVANSSAAPPRDVAAAADPARSAARKLTIAIDPGHGGEDPGAIGHKGTYEKNVVLAIARKLKARVDGDRQMRAMLTRDGDYFVPLAERVRKARRVQADLFISIHADAFRESAARGSSVFALSERGATSAAAKWLAQRENAADLIGGVDLDRRDPVLARTLLDLSQTAQISDSLKVGQHVLDGIAVHNALHKASVEQAGFAVLKAPDIPSILVETAFISNPEEEQKLRSDRHQRKFADSMYEGISRYFARNPPLARA